MSTDIEKEILELWRTYYADAWRKPPERQEFSDLCREIEGKSKEQALIHLQPGLAIFEFGLEWLTYLHVALSGEDDDIQKPAPFLVCWTLVGSAVSFGLSIRSLCLSGFDTPARALLRTYVEALLLCLATLHDKSLAEAYQAAQDDADVKTFWHTLASPKNLHRRIMEIEKTRGLEPNIVNDMSAWRRGEYEVLAQSAHLSYVAGCLTVRPPLIDRDDQHGMGILGQASASSLRTISYAARTTWYFSRFCFNAVFGHTSDMGLLILDKDNDFHQRLVIGRDVLSELTKRHWNAL